jgi:hypothetical protein
MKGVPTSTSSACSQIITKPAQIRLRLTYVRTLKLNQYMMTMQNKKFITNLIYYYTTIHA